MFEPKEIKFSKIRNIRDLGGYPTKDGRHVKYGLIFRGVGIKPLKSVEDLTTFINLRIKSNVDFRSRQEVIQMKDHVIPGMNYYHYPAMVYENGEEIDFSPEGIRVLFSKGEDLKDVFGYVPNPQEIFDHYYGNMLFNINPYGKVFDLLLDEKAPLYFHCTAGKDRTGAGAILILLALGVSREDAMSDYMYTNVCYKEKIEQKLMENAEKIKEDPSMRDEIISMHGVQRDIFDKQLDYIEEKYGDYDNFFKEHYHLNELDLARLRNLYTE